MLLKIEPECAICGRADNLRSCTMKQICKDCVSELSTRVSRGVERAQRTRSTASYARRFETPRSRATAAAASRAGRAARERVRAPRARASPSSTASASGCGGPTTMTCSPRRRVVGGGVDARRRRGTPHDLFVDAS